MYSTKLRPPSADTGFNPAVQAAAHRRPYVSIRSTQEYRWSVDAPTHFTWNSGAIQIGSVNSPGGRERDVLIAQHSLIMALEVEGSRSLVRLDEAKAVDRVVGVGDVTYLPPGHRLSSVSWGACRFVAVFLDPTVVSAALGEDNTLANSSFRPALLAAEDRTLRRFLLTLATAASQPGGPDSLHVESTSAALAEHLSLNYASTELKASPGVQRARRPMARLMDYVEDRIDGRLTLQELAATCGLSTSQTCRIARASLGVPLHRYVLSRRLARATNLLATTQRPISEIAALAGFSSQSHMTSLFKAHVGRTPAAFRRHASGR